ncbi:hypothetical protein GCM10007207_27850 [Asaia siamensis]|uniref:Transposase n=1 Tax=Asaia siamensis TaxID=110479 RepID=A0ABQ1MI35_9PROT|nr:hypothetical protein GCM10007207_27850 [Asaia siamensis]
MPLQPLEWAIKMEIGRVQKAKGAHPAILAHFAKACAGRITKAVPILMSCHTRAPKP